MQNLYRYSLGCVDPLSRAGFVWIMLVEIPNVFHGMLKVFGRLQGIVLHCSFIANSFHKILKFLVVEVTIQDGQYLMLDFAINFNWGQRRLLVVWNFILDM